jgi:uncharacterized protein YdaU (DUF1376 family)
MKSGWYPFFVVDYRRDTRHLTLEEDAAYRRLIDEYMVTREALPGDDEALARIVGMPKAEWTRLAVKVRRFFKARNDKLWHKRCELELRAQNARHNRFQERAKKGGIAKALKSKSLVTSSMPEACLKVPHYKRKKEDLSMELMEGAPVDECGQLTKKGPSEEANKRWISRKTRGRP